MQRTSYLSRDCERVLVISDVHVGDPTNRRLDDFVLDDALAGLLDRVQPARGTTLVIAGDFVDFAQTLPQYGKHTMGDRFGVTEEQSVEKLAAAMRGHRVVFVALRRFLARGGRIVVLPGNHDIDLHWPRVFAALRARLRPPKPTTLRFVPAGALFERGLYIEHGNQYAYDNRFRYWSHPIVKAPDGERLERPFGTLFMDLAYSDIKWLYPFANKVHSASQLARVALRSFGDDERVSVGVLGKLLAFFLRRGKRYLLSRALGRATTTGGGNPAAMLAQLEVHSRTRRAGIAAEAWRLLRPAEREALRRPAAAGAGLLGETDERGMKALADRILASGGATTVVMGHTHVPIDGNVLPEAGDRSPQRYFNTGGWVPHLHIGPEEKLRVADLQRRAARLRREAVSPRYLEVTLDATPRARLLPVPT